MESVEQQWQQQKENYEHMTEGELCALAEDAYDLTEIAREALQAVLSERGIAVRLKLEPPAESAEDEGLTILTRHGWPANAEQARMTMGALSAAGIPSFLGPDNVMHLEEFQGKFDGSVSLKIRDVDQERAFLALRDSELREPPAPPSVEPPEDDEGLINLPILGWPDNAQDARLTMGALSAAGILSFLGQDNVMHLEEFRGRFNGPVSLKVRYIDRDRAVAALRRALAAAWGDNKDPEEEKEYAILCPKCRSAQVVLEGRDSELAEPPPTAKFHWRCDACGYQWEDEGILQEVPGGQSWPGEEFTRP
jgi:DNA-directed RNA polymerase subunit M/transcription elongation factor TFIIS